MRCLPKTEIKYIFPLGAFWIWETESTGEKENDIAVGEDERKNVDDEIFKGIFPCVFVGLGFRNQICP